MISNCKKLRGKGEEAIMKKRCNHHWSLWVIREKEKKRGRDDVK